MQRPSFIRSLMAVSIGVVGTVATLTTIVTLKPGNNAVINCVNTIQVTRQAHSINAICPPNVTSTVPVATRTQTAIAATPTRLPPTATKLPSTATKLPSTATKLPPTGTRLPATATDLPATATNLPATATTLPPTATQTGAPVSQGACQFQKADQPLNIAFCDTFDRPQGTGNRSGDLNGVLWGVSRIIAGSGGENYPTGTNPSQGFVNNWAPVQLQKCGVAPWMFPDNDVAICNGQLAEAVNDDGGQAVLAMYPKQPFDIAGRTGTVTFDLSANSQGPHAAWPVFVYTDQPVPAPYTNAPGLAPYARNSIGFTLAADYCSGQTGVYEMFLTQNYVLSPISFSRLDCVTKSTSPNQLNHFEVRLSSNAIQVWASDAGTNNLKLIAQATGITVPLTRGLIWIEDVHYNANKFNTQQSHTFVWDNVGFDGPSLPRDLTFDVPENKTMDSDSRYPAGAAMQLGWVAPSDKPLSLTVPNVDHTAQATAALLSLNWFPTNQDTITYQVNGNAVHTQPWVFGSVTYSWKTVAMPIPLTELHDGNNVVALQTSDGAAVANIDIVLVAAGGLP